MVTAVGYHTFWEVAAEGGVGSRVLVTDKFVLVMNSGVSPTCLATVFGSSSIELWKLESPASYKLVGKFFSSFLNIF